MRNHHVPGRWLLVFAVLATPVGGRVARAQPKAAPPPAPAPAVMVVQQVWSDQQIDQWVFQQDRNAATARQRLNSVLAMQIETINRACDLTEAQQKKLQLAGRGDIKRFFDRYEEIKLKSQTMRRDENNLGEVLQLVRPLQMTLQAGLFHDDSLLAKSLPHTLTAEQLARYEAVARERREYHHRATVELAVTTLERGMPLRGEQRQKFINLLMSETKPPRKPSQYDYYLVMFQIGRIPEQKLQPLFDKAQWEVLNRQVARYKGMEPSLRQAGVLPDEGDDADRDEDRPAPKK